MQDIAEELLTGAYELRAIIRSARAPGSFTSESAERARDPHENDDDARTKGSYCEPISRLNRDRERIVAILSKKYRVGALLAPETEKQLDALRIQVIKIEGASGVLMRLMKLPTDHRARESIERYEAVMWSMAGDPDQPDPFEIETDAIVVKIEEKCRPILSEGPSAASP